MGCGRLGHSGIGYHVLVLMLLSHWGCCGEICDKRFDLSVCEMSCADRILVENRAMLLVCCDVILQSCVGCSMSNLVLNCCIFLCAHQLSYPVSMLSMMGKEINAQAMLCRNGAVLTGGCRVCYFILLGGDWW